MIKRFLKFLSTLEFLSLAELGLELYMMGVDASQYSPLLPTAHQFSAYVLKKILSNHGRHGIIIGFQGRRRETENEDIMKYDFEQV